MVSEALAWAYVRACGGRPGRDEARRMAAALLRELEADGWELRRVVERLEAESMLETADVVFGWLARRDGAL